MGQPDSTYRNVTATVSTYIVAMVTGMRNAIRKVGMSFLARMQSWMVSERSPLRPTTSTLRS